MVLPGNRCLVNTLPGSTDKKLEVHTHTHTAVRVVVDVSVVQTADAHSSSRLWAQFPLDTKQLMFPVAAEEKLPAASLETWSLTAHQEGYFWPLITGRDL